ncbi:MAG: hypothetical protein COY39_05120 [Alphaproteobacteria bacterium CG_4_10_14_0_8_um_filter_37_21]|nr:MAG: hypothetical protein COY39_05120 [Alphaproteobacteria bacterium CG_4_10_14_0_8_um_filter_37_21]
MMCRFFVRVKDHGVLCFFCAIAIIVFVLHMFSVYERNLWHHTTGKITYVKEIRDRNFMYTIEYMAKTDTAKHKVRLFRSDSSSPFKGQEVGLKYRKNDIQDFVLLGALKYMPESVQDKS